MHNLFTEKVKLEPISLELTKQCSCCKNTMDISCFYKSKFGKFGRFSACIKCTLIKQNKYNSSVKEKRKERSSQHYIKNKNAILIRNKRWAENNKEKYSEMKARYVKNNKDKIKAKNKRYYERNRDKIREVSRKKESDRLKSDSIFKLRKYVRNRVASVFRQNGIKKYKSTAELLGADFCFVKSHIEGLFKPGMSWDNHGFYGWHIDHIIPLCRAKTEEDVKKLCHYSNLQPLWAKENLQKSKK